MTPGVTVTVTLGEWVQTWTLGDYDPDTNELVNEQGCVLDDLSASWSSDGFMFQPSPTTVTMAVYVPAHVTSRPNLNGYGSVLIVPPDFDPAGPYDPLLEVHGMLSEGTGTPLRDGLRFEVMLTDPLAQLGEVRIGGTVDWPTQYGFTRMHQLRLALRGRGLLWDAAGVFQEVPAEAEYREWPIHIGAQPSVTLPMYPYRVADSKPANELLEEHLIGFIRWSNVPEPLQDYKIAKWFSPEQLHDFPPVLAWWRFYMRPIVVPATLEDGTFVYRTAWTAPRVEGDAGLPLEFGVDADGVYRVTAKAEAGTIPSGSRDGCWIPARAVPRDTVSWRVDKARHSNVASLVGWWQDWSEAKRGRLVSRPEIQRGYQESLDDFGRQEVQVDLTTLSDPDKPTPALNFGDFIAWALVGFFDDSRPRYTVESLDIIPEAIDNPDQWPRLFQQREQVPDEWFSAAHGRFVFVYGMDPKWNPEGRSHYFGQLVGADLTVSGGRLRMTARLEQRRPGPNGPRQVTSSVPEDWDAAVVANQRLIRGPDTAAALKWTDLPPTLTLADIADADKITARDLCLTTPAEGL